MSVIWSIAFLMLMCSIVWYLLGRSQEGFAAEPTTWDALRNFFHYQVSPVERPGGVPYFLSPGTSTMLSQLDGAIETPGFHTKAQSLFKFFRNVSDEDAAKNEMCRAIGHPRLLTGTRNDPSITNAGEQSGCGWLFFSDPTIPSQAAYGYGPTSTRTEQRNQVYDPAHFPVGGTFLWDISGAIRKEEVKRCRAIQTCSLLTATDNCGFCPARGHAVPVNNGAIKYTDQPVIVQADGTQYQDTEADGSCPTAVVTDITNCPARVSEPREFTGDFDYDINGNPIRNDLYLSVRNPQGSVLPDPCALVDGRIPKNCRLAMCTDIAKGTADMGLHHIVNTGILNETGRLALYYIDRRGGINLPASFWDDSAASPARVLTKSDAEDLLTRLNSLATSGPTSTARSAALWLLNETPFNPCDFQDAETAEYPLQCLQREFRKAGCQATGTAYPAPSTLQSYRTRTYGDIKAKFSTLYQAMNQDVANVREQDEAIEQCLGIQVKRADTELYEVTPNMCREQGVEFWFTTIPNIGQRILHDRRVYKDKDKDTPTYSDISGVLNAKSGVRGFTRRTYVELSGTPVTLTLQVPNVFYSLWINQVRIEPATGSYTKTTARTFSYRFPLYQRSEIEIRYETSTVAPHVLPVPTLTPNTPQYLAQSAWKPVVSVQARKEGFADDNRFLQFQSPLPETMQPVPRARWAVPIDGRSIISTPERGLWMTAARTITCMVWWSGFTGEATLWRLDQGNGGTGDTVLAARVIGQRVVVFVTSGTSVFRMESTAQLSNPNSWLHVAVVVGARLAETKIYINSMNRTPVAGTAGTTAITANGTIETTATQFTRAVLGGPGFAGSLGCFHIYTTALTEQQIQRDELYDDPRQSEVEDEAIRLNRN